MKKWMLPPLLALLLACTACAPKAEPGNQLSDAIGKALLEGLAQNNKPAEPAPDLEPSTKPAPTAASKPTPDPADLAWQEMAANLVGWWVDTNVPSGQMYLDILYFTEDGRVFIDRDSEYDYRYLQTYGYAVEYDDPEEDYAQYATEITWAVVDKGVVITKQEHDPETDKVTQTFGNITYTGGHNTEYIDITWSDGTLEAYTRASSPYATRLLFSYEDYHSLAVLDNLAYMRFDKNAKPDKDGFVEVQVKDVVWVDVDDEAAIQQYGLEDEPFDNDYMLYAPPGAEWRTEMIDTNHTLFRIVDYDADSWDRLVKYKKFRAHVDASYDFYLEDDSGMLVEYAIDEWPISAIREVYLP